MNPSQAPDAAPLSLAYKDADTLAAIQAGTCALLELESSLLAISALLDKATGNRRKRRAARKGKKRHAR